MTNKEAANWLRNISADIGKAEHRDLWHYEQALYEIREMLEDAPDANVGTMIYKQAAIDVLRTCYDTEAITYTNGNEYISYDQALDLIDELPSAQPDYSFDESCTDCAAYDHEHHRCPRFNQVIRQTVDEMKAERILCKDCYWWEKQQDSLQGRCARYGMYPTGAWFCGSAERREDE